MTTPEQQAQVEQWRKDFEDWMKVRGVWPRLTYEEIYLAGREAQ